MSRCRSLQGNEVENECAFWRANGTRVDELRTEVRNAHEAQAERSALHNQMMREREKLREKNIYLPLICKFLAGKRQMIVALT